MRTISPLLLLSLLLLLLLAACGQEATEIIPIDAVRVSLTPVRIEEGQPEPIPRGETQYYDLRPTLAREPREIIPNGFRSYTEIVLPYSGIWEPPTWQSKGRIGERSQGYILRIEELIPADASCSLLYDAYSQLDFYDYRVDESFGVDIPGYGEDWEWYLAHFPLESWSWLKGPSAQDRRLGELPFSELQGRWIYIWDQANIRSSNFFPAEDGGGILALQLSFYQADPSGRKQGRQPDSLDELVHFALRIRLDHIEAGGQR